MRAALAVLALTVLAAPASAADDPYRFKLLLGGGYQFGTTTYSLTTSATQYQETATVATAYTADAAPGFDVAAQFNAFKHIGFSAGLTIYDRDLSASYDASFPSPFFFNQPRLAAGSAMGAQGKQKERAWHLDVVAFGKTGAFDLSAWAGVSFFKVEADLLQNAVYTQSYPYTSVSVTSTPTTKVSDSPVGFNVGGSADWRFSRHVGIGIQARYIHAKAKLGVPGATPTDVDAGGFQLGGGVRFFF